jgi:hypothetical protein
VVHHPERPAGRADDEGPADRPDHLWGRGGPQLRLERGTPGLEAPRGRAHAGGLAVRAHRSRHRGGADPPRQGEAEAGAETKAASRRGASVRAHRFSDAAAAETVTDIAAAKAGPSSPPTAAEIDPFANVPDSPEMVRHQQASMGEMTRFVIAQSGIEEHRSPWRIAIFIGGAVAVLGGILFILSRLGVNLPGVHPHTKNDEKIFSASKDPNVLKGLLGEHKETGPTRPGPVSHGPRKEEPPPKDLGPLAHKEVQHVDQLDEVKRQQLKNIYASNKDPTVKVATQGQAPAIDRTDAPLSAQQVASTVAHFQSGYGRCVDIELKRNPGFHGGKIKIVTTIMSSGLVRQAEIKSDDASLAHRLTGSPLGGCLVDNTRRMVFPNFSGDAFDAEIPLLLGSSL